MKPQICVLDAVRIPQGPGPKGGDLKTSPCRSRGRRDRTSWPSTPGGAEVLGMKLADVPLDPGLGEAAGLGKSDYRSLALKEIAVS